MVVHDIGKGSMEGSEDVFIGGDDGGLVTITTGEVLRGDDRDCLSGCGFNQDHLGMVIGEIGVLDDAREERPEAKRFLRSLEIKDEVDSVHSSGFLDEEQAAQELLGDGEGSLPNGSPPDLFEHPFNDIGHLQGVRQITL